MKGISAALLLLWLGGCGAAPPGPAPAPDPAVEQAWSEAPAPAEIIGLLLRNAQLEILAEQPGCDSVFGAPEPRFTVGRYVAFLLGAMAGEPAAGESSRIEAACAPEGAAWVCSFFAAVGLGGESPWRYGLTFRVSGNPPEIDPASFSCPGGA
jgi:hypothetical protein